MPPSRDRHEPAAGQAPAEQLARLYRLSLSEGLSDATRLHLKELLLGSLDAGAEGAPAQPAQPGVGTPPRAAAALETARAPAALPADQVPPAAAANRSQRVTHPPEQPGAYQTLPDVLPPPPVAALPPGNPPPGAYATAAEAPPLAPAAVSRQSVEAIEWRLRQLVEGDAPWLQIEPLALRLYALRRDGEAAARVMELACLSAAAPELVALLNRFRQDTPSFYLLLHPAVRLHLLLRLYQERASEALAGMLYRLRDDELLQPLERLFIFLAMAGARDATAPYMYGRRFHQDLLQAAAEYGPRLGLTPSQLRLRLGRLAVDLGYHQEAQELLEPIDGAAPERDEALRLLLQTSVDRHRSGQNTLESSLLALPSTTARLAALARMLNQTRELGGYKDRNRPALNQLLANPFTWLNAEPEDWSTLADILLSHRDLEPLLPHLMQAFHLQAARFHQPALDIAFWQRAVQLPETTPREAYWRGVALVHYYVSSGASCESELWQGVHLLLEAQQKLATAVPTSWKDLHKAAFAWVARSPAILEVERARMLRQLRVAGT